MSGRTENTLSRTATTWLQIFGVVAIACLAAALMVLAAGCGVRISEDAVAQSAQATGTPTATAEEGASGQFCTNVTLSVEIDVSGGETEATWTWSVGTCHTTGTYHVNAAIGQLLRHYELHQPEHRLGNHVSHCGHRRLHQRTRLVLFLRAVHT